MSCLMQILLLQLMLLLVGNIETLPTIQQHGAHSGANYVQQLDKSFFQPREIEQTIDEVQKILANDPALPRLTRGEIEELYEKVTREEYEKSIEAGDMSRADSMRALMLVLPFNTDNNTEENLQELYTRPPVTRVIDAYTPPEPVKFITPDPNAAPRSTVPGGNPAVAATTYKPSLGNLPKQLYPAPTATTYHPPAPAPVMYQLAPSLGKPSMDFQPITKLPQSYDFAQMQAAPLPAATQTAQRFSSHYNAKNAQFLRKPKPQLGSSSATSTVKPVADILESLGIVGGIGGGAGAGAGAGAAAGQTNHKRYAIDDYYAAESAPQPVVAMADLRGLQRAKIRPDAYSNFKPLNIGEELRVKPEVEGYLTRFGIVKKSPKALKKTPAASVAATPTEEPAGAHTELSTATAKLPSLELAKLLENLQELERLQAQRNSAAKASSATSTTTTSTTTTSTTTTPAPATASTNGQLITHGAPLLIEAKKPRRRIDPNIDINFANAGNQQKTASAMEELSKLLQNLQELEKLQINPENVLKATTAGAKLLSNRFRSTTPPTSTTSTTTTTTTTTTKRPRNSKDAEELQALLLELQKWDEAANAFSTTIGTTPTTTTSSSSTTTTTSTTMRPKPRTPIAVPEFPWGLTPSQASRLGPADLVQLQKLLSDDRELERLYEQARNSKKAARSSTTSSSTSTTTTTTSTTPRPTRPATVMPTKAVDHAQFEALITRVQQLEQQQQPKSTTPGFLTRNVAATGQHAGAGLSLPSNDYAQLQQLAASAPDFLPFPAQGHVEISTAATVSKQQRPRQRPQLTNFERSNGLMQDVQPQDYVQLQKLLSKVQELERVQLQEARPTAAHQLVTAASVRTQNVKSLNGAQIVYAEPPELPSYLDEPPQLAGTKLDLPVYRQPTRSVTTPMPPRSPHALSSSEELREYVMSQPAHPAAGQDADFQQYQQFFSSLEDNGERQSYPHMQPIYKTIPSTAKPTTTTPTTTSTTTTSTTSTTSRPTTTTSRPTTTTSRTISSMSQSDLAELQKLLYNTQQLQKLGVALPHELSQQLENQLQSQSSRSTTSTSSTTSSTTTTTAPSSSSPLPAPDSSSPAVFSLTTIKPAVPRPPRPNLLTTESSVELPIFSATKIIEAAIKRAANRIGVGTEQSPVNLVSGMGFGFRRRSDDQFDVDAEGQQEGVMDGDLMAEFSELNYQLAKPESQPEQMENTEKTEKTEPVQQQEKTAEPMEPKNTTEPSLIDGHNLYEIQRLIYNLQQLQQLNVSLDLMDRTKSQADALYLQSQLRTQQAETNKTRRQSSDTNSTSTTTTSTTTTSTTTTSTTTAPPDTADTQTTQSPTRISLNLGLSDADLGSGNDTSSNSTTTEDSITTTTTEESRNGSLDDLADSFGPDPVSEEPPPFKKKNGFYFLADWNSFLEVGDGDDQIVVRFNPKVGDPRDFLPSV